MLTLKITGADLAYYATNPLPTLSAVFTAVAPGSNPSIALNDDTGVFSAPYTIIYTLDTSASTAAGTYSLTLPADLYRDGAGIYDATHTISIGVGWIPSINFYDAALSRDLGPLEWADPNHALSIVVGSAGVLPLASTTYNVPASIPAYSAVTSAAPVSASPDTGVYDSGGGTLTYALATSGSTVAAVNVITVLQGVYTDTAGAKNCPRSGTLNIGFTPLVNVRLGSGGSNVYVTDAAGSLSPTNFWVSRSTLPPGPTGAGFLRLSVRPPAAQGVTSFVTTPPAWGASSSDLFDGSLGGAAPSGLGAGTPGATGNGAGYTYTIDISTTVPGAYTVTLPQGAVTGAGGVVHSVAATLTVKVGWDASLTVRETLSGSKNDVTTSWLTGSSGTNSPDAVLFRIAPPGSPGSSALQSISSYGSPPDYTTAFYSPPISAGSQTNAWSDPSTSMYEFSPDLSAFATGQYVYKVLQCAFVDANGACNAGFQSDGGDRSGSSSGGGFATMTVLIGFPVTLSFLQNGVSVGSSQWVDADQTITGNGGLSIVVTSTGATTFAASYAGSPLSFGAVYTIAAHSYSDYHRCYVRGNLHDHDGGWGHVQRAQWRLAAMVGGPQLATRQKLCSICFCSITSIKYLCDH